MPNQRGITLRLLALLTTVSLAGCAGGADNRSGRTQDASAEVRSLAESATAVEVDVKRTWATYRDAALAKEGPLAAGQLSKETQALYGTLRDDALTLPAADLAGRPPTDQLNIMVMRAKFDPDELRTLNDEQVLARVFDLGLIDATSYITLDLIDVTSVGDTALADVVQDGDRINNAFLFRLEGDAWKLDLKDALDRANAGFVALAEQEGLTTTELVDRLIEIEHGVAGISRLRKPLDG